jgi:hypothetical protein
MISPILAALALLIAGNNSRKCPKCAEFVKPLATLCKHCGSELPISDSTMKSTDTNPDWVFRVCISDFSYGSHVQTCYETESAAIEAWTKKKESLTKARLLKYQSAIWDGEKKIYTGVSTIIDQIGEWEE